MTKQRGVTITELLGVFASALFALIPFAEQLSIPWRDGDSYDDWDAMAEALWENLVVGTIVEAGPTSSPLHLPRYDFSYDSYPFSDVLVVSGEGPELLVVQRIVLDGTPIARVMAARVRLSDRVCIGHEVVLLGESSVCLVRFGAGGSNERISEVFLT